MRKVVLSMFMSLDGVVENPEWTAPYWGNDIGEFKFAELFDSDAFLLGRVTYEDFAQSWPTMTDEFGFADRMNNLPKYVATRTLDTLTWNASPLKEPLVETIQQLKQQDGQHILVAGSANFAQTLMQHDLIDEYVFLVYPIAVGKGRKLFAEGITKNLTLVRTQTFASGVIALIYHPARP